MKDRTSDFWRVLRRIELALNLLEQRVPFKLVTSTNDLFICLFIFFLHLFILQAIYIVLQDLKMKMLFVELNIRLQE